MKVALKSWGSSAQAVKCFEEMGELIQAISKYYFSGKSSNHAKHRDNLIEEMADVCIMIDQLIMDIGAEEEFKDYVTKKFNKVRNKLIDRGFMERPYDPELDREIL